MNLKNIILISVLLFISVTQTVGQNKRTLLFDAYHGENARNAERLFTLIEEPDIQCKVDTVEISDKTLQNLSGIIIFSPTKPFGDAEKATIINFLKNGGSMILIMDEEKRTPLNGINDIIQPFGLELTETIPYLHNCGAIAEKSIVCKEKREIPYSGGRAVKGGLAISKVFMEGDYVHCAYKQISKGKIIVMSDGMAGLLMGQPDGVRLMGTVPADTKYWGKDSKIFMKEILEFFLQE
jgi:hypothetical protein